MEAAGQLAGGVAHDFNNLLTAIIGHADILSTTLPADDPNHSHAVGISEAAQRAAVLTRQLVAFSRKQVLEVRSINVNAVIENTAEMLRRLLGATVTVECHRAPDLATVEADAGQIEQILLNLALNARDAMGEEGELSINTRNVVLDEPQALRLGPLAPGAYVLIEVVDTGVGMDQATLARIFEPFFTTKKEQRGTGLGLSTVYGIAAQHGGSVAAESAPGKGTTVRVYLPAEPAAKSLDRTTALS
jgi:signal transduction histidine kinase